MINTLTKHNYFLLVIVNTLHHISGSTSSSINVYNAARSSWCL